ncbi:hypothetical protein [Rubinisphaera margarita]|uniref:hypothetical protein n=1 Tax=Rubinisphaera margarita TaxID=2909586 RepID=UPI001EE8ECCE|nr:hypothetical protein [Rubinisphaera margarita]MCG6156085.1 hypothetical protein [Rubinisphaera margarita]
MLTMPRHKKYGHCVCCNRETLLTFHHLIPRKMHRRPYFQKNYTKEELNRGICICRLCHNGIHDRHDEMTLAKEFPTFEQLIADGELQRHFAWVAKQKIKPAVPSKGAR